MKKGQKHSKESREKISKSLMGNKRALGFKQSEETKRKRSSSLKGTIFTEERKRKIGITKIGNKYWLGRKHSKKTKEKISIYNKQYYETHKHNWKGHHHSEESKKILSIKNTGKNHSKKTKEKLSEIGKKKWANPEYREKQIKAQLKKLFKRPTSLEQRFIKLIKKLSLPYKYTGDGEFILGGKCPDFVNTNHQKICIEVRPKSACKFWNKCSPTKYKNSRIRHFAKYGWECLVVWEEELQNLDGGLFKGGIKWKNMQ